MKKKRILFSTLLVFVAVITCILLVKNHNKTKMYNRIMLVSARYDYQDQQAPGKMTFALLDANNEKKQKKKIIKEIDIKNRRRNNTDHLGNPSATRNLIKGHKPNTYYFFSQGHGTPFGYSDFQFFPIIFNPVSNSISTEEIIMRGGEMSLYYPMDIDYRKENLLFHDASVYFLRREKTDISKSDSFPKPKDILSYLSNNFHFREIKGAKFIDANSVVIQAMDDNQENYILVSSVVQKDCQFIKEGFYPFRESYPQVAAPLDVSVDRKKVAFLASEELKTQLFGDAWLYVWDLNEKTARKIYRINDLEALDARYFKPNYLQWNPVDSNQIAVYSIKKLFIFNLQEKTPIILDIPDIYLKNFRWSPDGKKIGIIDYNGRLYIYDLGKKTTKKVSEDPDCFDFFWVE